MADEKIKDASPEGEPDDTGDDTGTDGGDDAATPETFVVPDDLSEESIDDDALAALSVKVKARGAELATVIAGGEFATAQLDEATDLTDVDVEIDAEMEKRAVAKAEKVAKAQAAVARFAQAAEGSDADAPADGGGVATLVEDAPADPAPAESAGLSEGARTFTYMPKRASALAQHSQAAPPRAGGTNDRAWNMESTGFAVGGAAEQPYESPLDVARAILKKRNQFGHIPAGQRDYLPIASGTKTFDGDAAEALTLDAEHNFAVLRGAQRQHETLVASGECCTPQTPLYEFFRTAVPQTPVEDGIPARPAPRGGIRFITAVCSTSDAAAGVGDYDCDDAAEDSPLVEKPCVRMGCPDIDEVLVQAVTQCVTFDNLRYRTFPEQVENFLEDLAVEFAAHKETNYLNAIDDESVQVFNIGTYGASRALLADWTLAAVGYRRRNRMRRDATLELFAPSWAIDLIKVDMLNDGDTGLSHINVPDSVITEALRSRGLNVTWYEDTATGADQGFRPSQSVGQLNLWPETVRAYLFAPGTFVRLDGGSLDVGIVRDSVLNSTNDLQIFMEEWWALAKLGCESIALSSDVCANGARADYVEAFTCEVSTS